MSAVVSTGGPQHLLESANEAQCLSAIVVIDVEVTEN
jgi:hypothetical protein